MTGDGGVVRHNDMIADDTIVPDMYVGHQQAVVTNNRRTKVLDQTAVDGDTLANDIVIADLERCRLTAVGESGRVFTNRRKLIDLVVATDGGGTFQDNVWRYRAIVADHHVRANHRPWPDCDIVTKFSAGIDDRARINHLKIHLPSR